MLASIVIEEPNPETEELVRDAESNLPPVFGRCPVCHKPLLPRNKKTGQMQAPSVGRGYASRARCGGCGTILCYAGNGEWDVLREKDLTPDDRVADLAGRD